MSLSPQDQEKFEEAIELLTAIFEELEESNVDAVALDLIANTISLLGRQLAMGIEFIYTEDEDSIDEAFIFDLTDYDELLAGENIPSAEEIANWYNLED